MRMKSKTEREGEDHLTRHVEAVPERAVRHLVAMLVAHRFRERAAGANPAAVRAFPQRQMSSGMMTNVWTKEMTSHQRIGAR